MSHVTFKGSPAIELLRRAKAPGAYRALAQVITHQEGQGGGPMMKFAQDTGVAWLPKALISRSKIEGIETTFLEFLESGMAYFLPFLGGPVLGKLFHSVAGKQAGFDSKLLTTPLAELEKHHAGTLDRVVPVKAAIIIATIAGIGLLGESLVNYGKNLMTAHFFRKDKFSDVVNLSQGHMQCSVENSPQVQKSRRRLKQVLLAFTGILGCSMALARFGHSLPSSAKSMLREGVRRFDFDFSKGRQYSIGRGLLGGIMLTSLVPYLDSARDKYERMETLCRLPVVFLYILFGQELLQKHMQKSLPNLFKSITRQSPQGKTQILELQELTRQAVRQAARECGKPNLNLDNLAGLPADVAMKAARNLQEPLMAKALHVLAPLGVGILGTGLGLGLISRFISAYRYRNEHEQPATAQPTYPAIQPQMPMNPAAQPMPSMPMAQSKAGVVSPFQGFQRGNYPPRFQV